MSFPTEDTQAALLLCARLGQRDDSLKPLTFRQYSAFVQWLSERSLRPGDLLQPGGRDQLSDLQLGDVSSDTVQRLLDRGAALGLLVERWLSQGLWIVSRGDAAYPHRYKGYLDRLAPPVLYGVGKQSLLQDGGLAIVGSRDASEEDLSFAERVSSACAAQGISIISGTAKGIDSVAMTAAVNNGGRAIGVLAEGLGRASIAAPYHDAIVNGRLTLISPYEPEARWLVFTAMERNKLIYALADAALVVAANEEQGGTWAGATEALKRAQIPIYVKTAEVLPTAIRKLVHAGAREFPAEPWSNVSDLFQQSPVVSPLFEQTVEPPPASECDANVASEAPAAGGSLDSKPASERLTLKSTALSSEKRDKSDPYDKAIELILGMAEPIDPGSVAEKLNIVPTQAKAFLKRAVSEGRIEKLKKRPVRYARTSPPPTLFPNEAEP